MKNQLWLGLWPYQKFVNKYLLKTYKELLKSEEHNLIAVITGDMILEDISMEEQLFKLFEMSNYATITGLYITGSLSGQIKVRSHMFKEIVVEGDLNTGFLCTSSYHLTVTGKTTCSGIYIDDPELYDFQGELKTPWIVYCGDIIPLDAREALHINSSDNRVYFRQSRSYLKPSDVIREELLERDSSGKADIALMEFFKSVESGISPLKDGALDFKGNNDHKLNEYLKNIPHENLFFSGLGFYEIPEEVFNCKYLEYLDISLNPISTLPGKITELKNLKVLNITGTKIDSSEVTIEKIKNLYALHIEWSMLRDIKDMSSLDNLKKLYIYGEYIDTQELKLPRNLKHLEIHDRLYEGYRDLDDYKDLEFYPKDRIVSDIPSFNFSMLPDCLEYLDVSGTYLLEEKPELELPALKNFKFKRLVWRRVTHAKGFMKKLYRQTTLEYLACDLSQDVYSLIPSKRRKIDFPKGISKLKNLEFLELDSASPFNLVSEFAKLEKLRKMVIIGCPVPITFMEKLGEALPGCILDADVIDYWEKPADPRLAMILSEIVRVDMEAYLSFSEQCIILRKLLLMTESSNCRDKNIKYYLLEKLWSSGPVFYRFGQCTMSWIEGDEMSNYIRASINPSLEFLEMVIATVPFYDKELFDKLCYDIAYKMLLAGKSQEEKEKTLKFIDYIMSKVSLKSIKSLLAVKYMVHI